MRARVQLYKVVRVQSRYSDAYRASYRIITASIVLVEFLFSRWGDAHLRSRIRRSETPRKVLLRAGRKAIDSPLSSAHDFRVGERVEIRPKARRDYHKRHATLRRGSRVPNVLDMT